MEHITPIADNAIVRGKEFNRLLKMVQESRVQAVEGMAMVKMGGGTCFSLKRSINGNAPGTAGTTPIPPAAVWFMGKVKGSEQYTDNIWFYDFIKVTKSAMNGYEPGSWMEDATESGSAYNGCEFANSAAGVQGDGVDIANLPSGFELQPIPPGVIVPMVKMASGDSFEYWFSVPNGVDGTCP
jgi:hypothetical protein